MSQINIAVIGAGRIAHSHFAGLLNLPQCYRYAATAVKTAALRS